MGVSLYLMWNPTQQRRFSTTRLLWVYLPIWTTPGWYYVSVGWKQNLESKSVKSYFLEILGGLKDHILCYKHYKYSGCLHTKKKANRSIVRATQYTEYKPHLKMSKLVPTKTSINTMWAQYPAPPIPSQNIMQKSQTWLHLLFSSLKR